MIHVLQFRRQFARMGEELNRQFQIVSGGNPTGAEGPDVTWVRRQNHYSLPEWQRRTTEFTRISECLTRVYDALFPKQTKPTVRRFV